MAPKGKPPAKPAKARKPPGKDKGLKGRAGKKAEPGEPFIFNSTVRNAMLCVTAVVVMCSLVIFLLCRVQRRRAIETVGAVETLRGVLMYLHENYAVTDGKLILSDIQKLVMDMKIMQNKTVFALNEVWETIRRRHKGWVFYYKFQYLFSNDSLDFDEAAKYCRKHGGYLTDMVHPVEQYYFVRIGTNLTNNYWIGLSKEQDEWKWLSGEKQRKDTTFWAHNQETIGTGRRCAAIQGCTFARYRRCWINVPCTQIRNFICKVTGNPELMKKEF